MSLHDVLEEIRPGYSSRRRRRSSTPESAASNGCVQVVMDSEDESKPIESQIENLQNECDKNETQYVIEKERKRTKRRTASTQKKNPHGDMLYNSIIIGDISIDGFNLLPGERLVVAKLTPIVVRKQGT